MTGNKHEAEQVVADIIIERKPGRYAKEVLLPRLPRKLVNVLREVLRPEDLANFRLAFPSWPMLFMKLHEVLCSLDRFFLRLQLELRIAANHLFGFGVG